MQQDGYDGKKTENNNVDKDWRKIKPHTLLLEM